MSAHVYHEGLPGYDPQNVLHDGCPECEARSRRGMDGVLAVDHDRQLRLWRSCYGDGGISDCDARLRGELYSVMVFLWHGAGISPEEVSRRWRT